MRIEPIEITYNFVKALNKKFQGKETPAGPIEFAIEDGGKYFDKIIVPNLGGSPDDPKAHAFVERQTGKLYRASSWSLPVVDFRYDLSREEDFTLAVELADPYGNYLRRNYARKTFAGII